MSKQKNNAESEPQDKVRARVMDTACALFYKHGVRAVGVDLVVEKAGVAKTSLYRHFKTKDELVAAFLHREDQDFWGVWDEVAEKHRGDAAAELVAHLRWIGERVARSNYRGCPQINVAAEFPETGHPARKVATAHKLELRRRLKNIATRLGALRPDELAGQLSMLVNGAFVSSQILKRGETLSLLQNSASALVTAAGVKRAR